MGKVRMLEKIENQISPQIVGKKRTGVVNDWRKCLVYGNQLQIE